MTLVCLHTPDSSLDSLSAPLVTLFLHRATTAHLARVPRPVQELSHHLAHIQSLGHRETRTTHTPAARELPPPVMSILSMRDSVSATEILAKATALPEPR
jgi:hypothetical protein